MKVLFPAAIFQCSPCCSRYLVLICARDYLHVPSIPFHCSALLMVSIISAVDFLPLIMWFVLCFPRLWLFCFTYLDSIDTITHNGRHSFHPSWCGWKMFRDEAKPNWIRSSYMAQVGIVVEMRYEPPACTPIETRHIGIRTHPERGLLADCVQLFVSPRKCAIYFDRISRWDGSESTTSELLYSMRFVRIGCHFTDSRATDPHMWYITKLCQKASRAVCSKRQRGKRHDSPEWVCMCHLSICSRSGCFICVAPWFYSTQ